MSSSSYGTTAQSQALVSPLSWASKIDVSLLATKDFNPRTYSKSLATMSFRLLLGQLGLGLLPSIFPTSIFFILKSPILFGSLKWPKSQWYWILHSPVSFTGTMIHLRSFFSNIFSCSNALCIKCPDFTTIT